jgi:cell division initiation protein
MAITPLDITQQRFRARFGGGLDKGEVDAFLTAVASEMERLIRDNQQLKDDERHFKRLLEDYRAREEALKETMITAQRVTEEIKKAAEKEADILLGRAELEAERILEQAQARLTELLSDIGELKRQRAQFLSQLKGVIQTHDRLVQVAEEDEQQGRRVEENLAVMRKRPAPVQTTAPQKIDDAQKARS